MRTSIWSQLLIAGSCLAQGDLVSLLKSQEDLSTLLELVGLVPGLAGILGSSTNITIVAPTNKAFQELPRDIPEGEAVEYRNDTIAIGALLANHVIKGVYPASAITNIPTFAQNLLNDSYVSAIQPFGNVTGGSYVELVKNGQNVAVVTGEQTVSIVTQADIKLGAGITIHKIDTVLSFGPPLQLYTYRAGFTALNGALEAAKLNINFGLTGADVQTLNISDYTVLIPDNAAFDAIGSVIKSADTKTLQDVLSYHLIPKNIIFSTALGNVTVKSLQGTDLTFTVLPDGSAWVNNAKITYPNNILYDGVAHIIDSVLSPAPFDRANLKPQAPAAARIAFPGASAVSTALFPSASLAFAGDMMTYSTTPALLRTVAAIATTTGSVSTPTANGTITRPPVATFTGAGNMLSPALPAGFLFVAMFIISLL